MKTQKGNCPVCKEDYTKENFKSGHHELPKRYFHGLGNIYYLCRRCHNDLELLIPTNKKLSVRDYKIILSNFIELNKQMFERRNKNATIR